MVGSYAGDAYTGKRHEKQIDAGDWLHVPLNDPDLRLTFDGKALRVKPGYENHPMTVVTWFGAKAYCEFNGGRLPSEMPSGRRPPAARTRGPIPGARQSRHNKANFYNSEDPFEKVSARAATRRRWASTTARATTATRRSTQPAPRRLRHGGQRLAVDGRT